MVLVCWRGSGKGEAERSANGVGDEGVCDWLVLAKLGECEGTGIRDMDGPLNHGESACSSATPEPACVWFRFGSRHTCPHPLSTIFTSLFFCSPRPGNQNNDYVAANRPTCLSLVYKF
jgi:hypothetical protein